MATKFTTAESKAVYDDARLPGVKAIWEHFLALVETPRGSGQPEPVRSKILQWGKDWGYESFIDEIGNVIIRKPAAKGYENRPGVCLQAHYDMVAVKDEGVDIDMTKDPLKPRLLTSPKLDHSASVLMATGTSLGGDDGIGCAIILAILQNKDLKHGPIDALFTTDEETTMLGSENLKRGTITTKYLINVDSEEDWRICIGCAGGYAETLTIDLKKGEFNGERIEIWCKGLQGGHSGVEINEGRANAIKLLGRAVNQTSLAAGVDTITAQYFVCGDKRNVIPHTARSQWVVPSDKKESFLKEFERVTAEIKKEWKAKEPTLEFTINASKDEGVSKQHKAYDVQSTRRFLDAVLTLPHGVLRMSPNVPGLVQTSTNLAKVVLCDMCEEAKATFETFSRSMDDEEMKELHEVFNAHTRSLGATSTGITGWFPGWLPDTENKLLDVAKQEFKRLRGVDADIYAIHAGLECGILQEKIPGVKCISVGPYLTNVHSPQETLYVDTVPKVYDLILSILEKID